MKHLLKGFKKVSTDDKATTFEHPNGHMIKVAHGSLSKDMKKRLSDLPHYADGGYVGDKDRMEIKRGQTQESFTKQKVNSHEDTNKEYAERRQKYGPSAPRLSLPAGMADGGDVPEFNLDLEGKNLPPMKTPLYEQPDIKAQADYSNMFGFEAAPSNMQNMSMPNSEQISNIPLPQVKQPPANQAQSMLPQPLNYEKYLGQMEQGQRAEANAIGNQGMQEAKAAETQMGEQQKIMQHYEEESKRIDNERISVYNDLRTGHIDPNHFVNNMSGFEKGMSALGLILGGAGAGLTHTDNDALKFLNSQIDRDIDSQKAEMDKKHNLVSILNQQFGNLKDATTMARAMQSDMYATKLQQLADQSKNPQVQAKAMQAIGQMHMQYEPQMQEMKIRQAVLNGMSSGNLDPSVAVRTLVPEHERAKAYEELKDVQQIDKSITQVSDAMRRVQKLQGAGSRLLSPLQSKSEINALNLQVKSLAKEMFGKVSDTEIGQIEGAEVGVTDNPQTVQNKINILTNILKKHRTSPILQSYGIRIPEPKQNKFTPR